MTKALNAKIATMMGAALTASLRQIVWLSVACPLIDADAPTMLHALASRCEDVVKPTFAPSMRASFVCSTASVLIFAACSAMLVPASYCLMFDSHRYGRSPRLRLGGRGADTASNTARQRTTSAWWPRPTLWASR